ncbi:hypothetical protein LIER_31153 [Lithospermum erythrorhizon]|uniref:VQ domain-containing protein n=1 Tax=Lithospermum erythrorhizon TaxID=34254 RepID=A0AAV3RQS2_LITER
MAYSDNLMTMDPSFMLHNAFPDTWLPDNFSRETETIAKALQKSFDFQDFDNNLDFSSELLSPSPWLNNSDSTTVSGGSVEQENNSLMASKRVRNNNMVVRLVPNGDKIKKRRSRASKRGTTTFINADVENFRQLVQEVTGLKFGGGGGTGRGGVVVKPEAHRVVNKLQMIGGGGGLHTLDTSAFLVGPTNRSNQLEKVGGGGGGVVPPSAAEVVVGGGGSACSTTQFDFDSYCSFPTLESWKAI